MAQMLFSQIKQAPRQNFWKVRKSYTASLARRQHSADVVEAQCMHCERRKSVVRAQRFANENSVRTR